MIGLLQLVSANIYFIIVNKLFFGILLLARYGFDSEYCRDVVEHSIGL
jgi:hypothetical protein